MLMTARISLPDRPGALGWVTTALGAAGANIVTLDVVERTAGFAVDQIGLEVPPGAEEGLRRTLEDIPGIVIEEMRAIPASPDILAPMELAAALAEAGEDALEILVDHLPGALGASWAAAVTSGRGGPEVLAASEGSPPFAGMGTPWLPLEGPRRLPLARWMPTRWRTGLAARLGAGIYEAAAAPLFDPHTAVLLGRRTGPRFRSTEVAQLGFLARITAAVSARPVSLRAGGAL